MRPVFCLGLRSFWGSSACETMLRADEGCSSTRETMLQADEGCSSTREVMLRVVEHSIVPF